METVSFTRMDQGTAEDYALISRLEEEHKQANSVADSVLGLLKSMQGPTFGFQIDRYQHSLQSATLALRDEADEESVVAALLHDIGDVYAPDNHSEFAASVLKPYVSEETYWVVKHHGLFQGYYFYHYIGRDRDGREQFRGHPHFQACVDFCKRWDQRAFDPNYDTLPLDAFEPMVQRIFARAPRFPD